MERKYNEGEKCSALLRKWKQKYSLAEFFFLICFWGYIGICWYMYPGLSPELFQEFRGHLGSYGLLSWGPRKPFHLAPSYSTSSYTKKSLPPWLRHAILSKDSWRTQTTSWPKIILLSTANSCHIKCRCLAGLQCLTVLQVPNLWQMGSSLWILFKDAFQRPVFSLPLRLI